MKLTAHFHLEPTLSMRDAVFVALWVVDLSIVKCSEKNWGSKTTPGLGKGKGKSLWGDMAPLIFDTT